MAKGESAFGPRTHDHRPVESRVRKNAKKRCEVAFARDLMAGLDSDEKGYRWYERLASSRRLRESSASSRHSLQPCDGSRQLQLLSGVHRSQPLFRTLNVYFARLAVSCASRRRSLAVGRSHPPSRAAATRGHGRHEIRGGRPSRVRLRLSGVFLYILLTGRGPETTRAVREHFSGLGRRIRPDATRSVPAAGRARFMPAAASAGA